MVDKNKKLERNKKWRESEQGKRYKKEYNQRPESKEKDKQYHREYYWRNREKCLINRKKFRSTEAAKDWEKQYFQKRYDTIHGRAMSLCNAAKNRASIKKLPCNITTEMIEQRMQDIQMKCEVTGLAFDLSRNSPNAPSIDQRIPGHGYSVDNFQIVVLWYNRMKGEYSDEVAIALLKEAAEKLK